MGKWKIANILEMAILPSQSLVATTEKKVGLQSSLCTPDKSFCGVCTTSSGGQNGKWPE